MENLEDKYDFYSSVSIVVHFAYDGFLFVAPHLKYTMIYQAIVIPYYTQTLIPGECIARLPWN